jgi:hypothetical protein
MAAYYARDYRDALTRLARFKQLCTPEELQIKIGKDECSIEPVWQHAQEETPPLLTDAAFASFVELGRLDAHAFREFRPSLLFGFIEHSLLCGALAAGVSRARSAPPQ